MKYLLILALCFTSAVMVMSKTCSSNDDCEEGECCLGNVFTTIRCEALTKEDEECSTIGQRENQGVHYFQCPCKPGLACENTEEMEIFGKKIGYNPKCVKPKDKPEAEE